MDVNSFAHQELLAKSPEYKALIKHLITQHKAGTLTVKTGQEFLAKHTEESAQAPIPDTPTASPGPPKAGGPAT